MIVKRNMIYSPKKSNRMLHIYLPDDYYESEERYPVMYFFDGHNLFTDEDATYGKSWGMKKFLDHYDKKFIIVGMECGHEGYERLGEYSPYCCFRKEEKPMGDDTMRWIVEEIKPMIDKEYRTWSHREATGIGGSSMGGIMALYALVHYNRWFSKGACVSSAIGYCMDHLMKDMKESEIHPDTRAFLSWGTREAWGIKDPDKMDDNSNTYHNHKKVEEMFLKKQAMPYLYCQIGGNHCEADWEKQVAIFMDYLWK
ncbi:MAG: alpha/beta hydrolase-fold protein [Eubacteriales bacterium]|nr:alpha/beta hydrolase-fold protein [Eubacteriales bacterium]